MAPPGLQGPASALSASPTQASAMPAKPRPNFFSAPRRVTDWAMFLASSSNLSFILSFSFGLVFCLRQAIFARRLQSENDCGTQENCRRSRAAERNGAARIAGAAPGDLL